MSIEARIAAIKAAESRIEVILAYGEFVEYYEKHEARLKKQVRRSARRDWSPARVSLAKIKDAPSVAHKAIADKFGESAMYEAINAFPFS